MNENEGIQYHCWGNCGKTKAECFKRRAIDRRENRELFKKQERRNLTPLFSVHNDMRLHIRIPSCIKSLNGRV